MSVQVDFTLSRVEVGTLDIPLEPPTAVGGWTIEYQMWRRQGATGTPLSLKSIASGYDAVSGITMINSGQGMFRVSLAPADVSGMSPGNYYYQIIRTDSGQQTLLTQGYRMMG